MRSPHWITSLIFVAAMALAGPALAKTDGFMPLLLDGVSDVLVIDMQPADMHLARADSGSPGDDGQKLPDAASAGSCSWSVCHSSGADTLALSPQTPGTGGISPELPSPET